jgi:hypothetical protein
MKTIVDFCKIQIFINIGAFFPFYFCDNTFLVPGPDRLPCKRPEQ